jgi:Uma2 family endonuclease
MATAAVRRRPALTEARPETVADLLRRLGNVPARRVRLHPPLGTATERDLIRNNESKFKTAICELVDGCLVEKPVGWEESAIAFLIGQALLNFVRPRRLGTVLAPDGMLRLVPGLLRAPDVSFLARGKLTRYKRGGKRIPSVAADLAVEVVSKSNTKAEIARKLNEYFAAGTRLAWVVDPKTQTVRVHTAPRKSVVLGLDGILDGGDVLPGFRLPVRDVFELEDD